MSDNTDRAIVAQREWAAIGQPEKRWDIQRYLDRGEEVPEALLHASRVSPEKNANDPSAYEPPARSGKGSGKAAWVEFAAKTTDIEADVLEAMDRGDIVKLLEDRNIIEEVS